MFQPVPVLNLLCELGAARSKAEARRLISSGMVLIDGVAIEDGDELVVTEVQVKVGKKVSFTFTPKPQTEDSS